MKTSSTPSKKRSAEVSSLTSNRKCNKTDPFASLDDMVKGEHNATAKRIESNERVNMAKIQACERMHKESLEASNRRQEMFLAAEKERQQESNRLMTLLMCSLGTQNPNTGSSSFDPTSPPNNYDFASTANTQAPYSSIPPIPPLNPQSSYNSALLTNNQFTMPYSGSLGNVFPS